MSIKLQLPKLTDLRPKLTVIGVGGAGCNAINNMIAAGLNGVDFVVANTDAQALAASSAEHRVQLGINLTEGLGAGAKPEVGEAAAEEAIEDIRAQISGSHMVFIAAGMGGGTGTGAATVIARIAKELGILAVGVVTKPFQFEGARRMRIAEAGIAELRKVVDTLIVIPNQNLFRIASEKTTFAEAFVLADQVLYSGVACIVDLIVKEGLINLDFADVRTIMSGMGTAMMGTGEAAGDRRAIMAAEEAISNPLLDDVTLKGAKGLLLSITGGPNLTLYEVDEAASRVRQEVDSEANIIVGATFDDTLGDRVRVSIVASGMARIGEVAGSPAESWPRANRRPPPAEPAQAPTPTPASKLATAQAPAHSPPREEEDMQRRLSEALQPSQSAAADRQAEFAYVPAAQHVEHVEPAPAAPSLAPAPFTAAETWRAPGNVMIEEGLPPLRTAAPPPRRAVDAPHAPGANSGGFVPAPPVDIPRGQRRMPQVEDFPPVVQREIRAKVQPAPLPPQIPESQPGSFASQAAVHRRPGFFERITGRMRRGSDSPGDSNGTRATVESQTATEGSYRAVPQHAQAQPQSRQRAGGRAQEEAELPVFFSRDRK